MLHTDTVDSTKGTPADSAARAAWTSARRANIPPRPNRREDHGKRELLTEHLHALVSYRDVAHDDLAEQDALEIAHVRAQRGFLVRAAVEIIEELTGEPAAGELAVVEHRRRGEPERSISAEPHGASVTVLY